MVGGCDVCVGLGVADAAGDVEWDEPTLVSASLKALRAGLAAGVLGLGAGPTILPTQRLLGMPPTVS